MNFNIKRMKKAVEAPSVKVPKELKGKALRAWIINQEKLNPQKER